MRDLIEKFRVMCDWNTPPPPSPPSFICHPVTSAFVREAILVIEGRKRVYCESVSTGENYSSCAKLEFVKDYSFIKI